MTEKQRAARIAVLEEAAKAICHSCRDEDNPAINVLRDVWLHDPGASHGGYSCAAGPIHKLILES